MKTPDLPKAGEFRFIPYFFASVIVIVGLCFLDQDLEPPRIIVAGSQMDLDATRKAIESLHLQHSRMSTVVPDQTTWLDTGIHWLILSISTFVLAAIFLFLYQQFCQWLERKSRP